MGALSLLHVMCLDTQEAKIVVLSVDDGTVTTEREIPLTFEPGAIAYDRAYEVFYVSNAKARAGVPAAQQVVEVFMSGRTTDLFDLSASSERFLADTTVTSMFYSPYTGTTFILCSECAVPSVIEVGEASKAPVPVASWPAAVYQACEITLSFFSLCIF